MIFPHHDAVAYFFFRRPHTLAAGCRGLTALALVLRYWQAAVRLGDWLMQADPRRWPWLSAGTAVPRC